MHITIQVGICYEIAATIAASSSAFAFGSLACAIALQNRAALGLAYGPQILLSRIEQFVPAPVVIHAV